MALDVELERRLILNLQDQAIPEGTTPRVAGLAASDYPAYRQALIDAKLADVFDDSHLAERAPHRVFGLTALGQKFSECIRDESAWNVAKEEARQAGESLTLAAFMRRLLVNV